MSPFGGLYVFALLSAAERGYSRYTVVMGKSERKSSRKNRDKIKKARKQRHRKKA